VSRCATSVARYAHVDLVFGRSDEAVFSYALHEPMFLSLDRLYLPAKDRSIRALLH